MNGSECDGQEGKKLVTDQGRSGNLEVGRRGGGRTASRTEVFGDSTVTSVLSRHDLLNTQWTTKY